MIENRSRVDAYKPPDDMWPNESRLHEFAVEMMQKDGFTKTEIENAINHAIIGRAFLTSAGMPDLLADFIAEHYPIEDRSQLTAWSDERFDSVLFPGRKPHLTAMSMLDIFFTDEIGFYTRVSAGLLDDTHIWGYFGRRAETVPQDSEVSKVVNYTAQPLSLPLRNGFITSNTFFEEAQISVTNQLNSMYGRVISAKMI